MSKPASSKVRNLLIIFTVLGLTSVAWYFYTLGKITTDDAFIERDLVYLSPRVSGRVLQVTAAHFQTLKAGDPILQLDPAPYQAALDGAEAALARAKADELSARAERIAFSGQLTAQRNSADASVTVAESDLSYRKQQLARIETEMAQADRDVERYDRLAAQNQVSRQALDQVRTQATALKADISAAHGATQVATSQLQAARIARTGIDAEEARLGVFDARIAQAESAVKQALAALEQARLNLAWTQVNAPVDGQLSQLQRPVGSEITPGTAVAILVSGQPWVKANYKETQLEHMRIGDEVVIEIDAFPGRELKGRVAAFQPGTGSRFAVLPPENATGNFVKVVQRLPVRIDLIDIPDDLHLEAGMSVIPTVLIQSTSRQDES